MDREVTRKAFKISEDFGDMIGWIATYLFYGFIIFFYVCWLSMKWIFQKGSELFQNLLNKIEEKKK